jgi:hypothetical protein
MRAEPSGGTVFGLPNGQFCATSDFDLRTQTLAFPVPAGTTRLQQLVICGAPTCDTGATMHTTASVVTIEDPVPPTLSLSGPLVERRWVSGTRLVVTNARDNVGIASHTTALAGVADRQSLPCNYTAPRPCTDFVARSFIATEQAPQGPNQLSVDVVDGAGNPAHASQTIYVDNQPPERVRPLVEGGEQWRSGNGFKLLWVNPAQAYAPIVRAHYRLCSSAGCGDQLADGPDIDDIGPIQLPAPGDYTVRVWLEDEAGNESYDLTASDPVHLRFDPEAPRLTFEPPDPADPLRVSVLVDDRYSGMATGEIEMRERGGDTWHALQTKLEGSRLVGYVDDERFRSGAYEFRARAADLAGNEGSTNRRANGARATIDLPVRFVTRLKVGLARAARPRVRPMSRAQVRYGRRIKLAGRLTNVDGQPLDGASVEVFADTVNDATGPVSAGIAHTDKAGRFSYVALANQSKVLRFRYPGSRRIRSAEANFRLGVPAVATIRARPRSLLNGETVTLSGSVRTRPLPVSGKLIEIQAFFRSRWRTFSTTRAGPDGRWIFEYQFGATRGQIRYRLRARLPAEGGYPFDTGYSPVARVLVSGL